MMCIYYTISKMLYNHVLENTKINFFEPNNVSIVSICNYILIVYKVFSHKYCSHAIFPH